MRKNILIIFLIVGSIFIILHGCKDNGSGPEIEDTSLYYVKLTMDTLQHTYPGGGGIFVIHRGDSVKSDETVEIEVETDPSIKYSLSRNRLTKDERIAEMELYPDSNIVPDRYPVKFICRYGNKIDTLKATIWHWLEIPNIRNISSIIDFVEWIDRNKPEYSISKETNWKCYCLTPASYVGGSKNKFLNEKWEVTYIVATTLPTTYRTALRRRFIDKYFTLAMKINELYKVEEISPKDFYLSYSTK